MTAMMTSSRHTTTVYGREYRLQVGSVVRPENWHSASRVRLADGEGYSESRLPTCSGGPTEDGGAV
jgi:hypothetical protein